jgi:hypothetical protein
MRRGSSSVFINAFLDLPQHVSASYRHHQGVVVSSEATQAVCVVDVQWNLGSQTPLITNKFSEKKISIDEQCLE